MFKGFVKEFKDFAIKGNVMDIAVAVVIGAAFGKIVTALVNDIVMPIVGILFGGTNFTSLTIVIGEAEIRYGAFIQSIVDFAIIALVIFLLIKFINRFKSKVDSLVNPKSKECEEKAEETAKEATAENNEETSINSEQTKLLSEIRDLLKEASQK